MMIDEIMDCFVNPIKSKIILAIQVKEQVTAKQLMELDNDIPQATLYRTLNRLVKAEIIEIVAENRIRGVVEKVYSINKKADLLDVNKIVTENNGEGYLQMFSNYTMALMREFSKYAKRQDIDILHDGSGFISAPICVTPEELNELALKVAEVMRPYVKNTPAPERKMHTMAVIYTPPAGNTKSEKESEDFDHDS